MRIGELSRRTGASVRSIRHYERQGLVAAVRGPNGYREFAEDAVELVKRIRVLLRNGLTVEEIRPVAVWMDETNMPRVCDDVIAIYHAKLDDLQLRIQELERLREQVRQRVEVLELQRRQRQEGASGATV